MKDLITKARVSIQERGKIRGKIYPAPRALKATCREVCFCRPTRTAVPCGNARGSRSVSQHTDDGSGKPCVKKNRERFHKSHHANPTQKSLLISPNLVVHSAQFANGNLENRRGVLLIIRQTHCGFSVWTMWKSLVPATCLSCTRMVLPSPKKPKPQ